MIEKISGNALVVGGNSGIGLGIALELLDRNVKHIYVVGKTEINFSCLDNEVAKQVKEKIIFIRSDLTHEDYSWLEEIDDIDILVFTAGFGRITYFENLLPSEITALMKCNALACMRIVRYFYDRIKSEKVFYCAVLGSIAGHIVSPLFSVYGASKSALCSFIENINAELNNSGTVNRILDVSPGSINGTSFNGGDTDLKVLGDLSRQIVDKMFKHETLFIPHYEDIFKCVIEQYRNNPKAFAKQSIRYKMESNRVNNCPQVVVGYLSGTFDLFHVGHLNLLRRAKAECDYLIVGLHKSGAWKGKQTFIPFEERKEILESICYVDKVIESYTEDCDAWNEFHYDKLFVGSDYVGTERFARYEKELQGKAEIIYFPYTKGTSSTQLREALDIIRGERT